MCATVFPYARVLADDLPEGHLGRFAADRSTRPATVPTVLSAAEAYRVMADLLCGTGLRVMECCTLRLRDLDFDRAQILVRAGKGQRIASS